MSDSKKFSLGGFPPIYEQTSTIKSKEYKPNSILSIQAILSKRNLNRSSEITQNNSKVIKVRDKI